MENIDYEELEEAIALMFETDIGMTLGSGYYYGQMPIYQDECVAFSLGLEIPRSDSQVDIIMIFVSKLIGRYQTRTACLNIMGKIRNSLPKHKTVSIVNGNNHLVYGIETRGFSVPYKVQHDGNEMWEFSLPVTVRNSPYRV